MHVYKQILEKIAEGKKLLAVLVDPGKFDQDHYLKTLHAANEAHADILLFGSSLWNGSSYEEAIEQAKSICDIPCVLFPSNLMQISDNADGMLLLSLLSGRNPEFLIGRHVEASAYIKKTGVEVIPTAYILIDSGRHTSVHYMSQTIPIPADKTDIAVATALAGQLLGMKCIYLEAGSGARNCVPVNLIRSIKAEVDIPIIVGGGIRNTETAREIIKAGADIVVVGNIIEENTDILYDLSAAIHSQAIRKKI